MVCGGLFLCRSGLCLLMVELQVRLFFVALTLFMVLELLRGLFWP